MKRVSIVLLIYQSNERDNGKVGRMLLNMVAVLGMVQYGAARKMADLEPLIARWRWQR